MLVAIPAWICLKFLPDGAPDPLWVALIVLGPAAVLSVAVNLLPLRGLDGEMAWQLLRRRRANPGRVVQFRQGGRHGR
jgi:hypothetical protein